MFEEIIRSEIKIAYNILNSWKAKREINMTAQSILWNEKTQ